MARNRFEQVDELQPDAINLTVMQKSDGQVGIVHCPKTAALDRLPADLTSPEIRYATPSSAPSNSPIRRRFR
jgi:hypothetical protein